MSPNIQTQVKCIKQWCIINNYEYKKLATPKDIKNMFNLLKYNKCTTSTDPFVLNYYGIYYSLHKNIPNMYKCYNLAIDKGCITSLHNLGFYYQNLLKTDNSEENINNMKKYYNLVIEKCAHIDRSSPYFNSYIYTLNNFGDYYSKLNDEENMLKYYNMGIDVKSHTVFNYLGRYYERVQQFDMAKKFYLIGSEKKDKYAAFNLGVYYANNNDIDNMLKYYLLSIELGYAKAAYYVGRHYYDKKDYNIAIKYYNLGVKKGDTEAMDKLGRHYEIMKDYPKMFKFFTMAIDRNCIDAMVNLGRYYKKQNNFNEMLKLYQMAYEKGDVDVNRLLGDYYATVDDVFNMLKYYEIGADKKNSECIKKLIDYYKSVNGDDGDNGDNGDNGKDGTDNSDKIAKYCEIGFNTKEITTMSYVLHYYEGIKDYTNADKYLELIMKEDNIMLWNDTGVVYHNQIVNVHIYNNAEVDSHTMRLRENMEKLYLLAINKNYGQAMRNLALYYKTQSDYNPESVECRDEMIKYYELACETGHVPSMIEFGDYYYNLKDHLNLLKYYNMAIDKGDTTKLVTLAEYCEKKMDYVNMIKYYSLSVDCGNDNSMNWLGYYYKQKREYEPMLKYLLMGVEKGNVSAMCNLGDYYRDITEYDKMKKCYEMGIKVGNAIAMNNYGYYHSVVNHSSKKLIKKYYGMSIKNGNLIAIDNLAAYYRDTKNYDKMKTHALSGMEKGSRESCGILGKYYFDRGEYDDAIRCFDLGLERKSILSIGGFNTYLEKSFDVKLAFKHKTILFVPNRKKLDSMINMYIRLRVCIDNESKENKESKESKESKENKENNNDKDSNKDTDGMDKNNDKSDNDNINAPNDDDIDIETDDNVQQTNIGIELNKLYPNEEHDKEITMLIEQGKVARLTMPSYGKQRNVYFINDILGRGKIITDAYPIERIYAGRHLIGVYNMTYYNNMINTYNELNSIIKLNKETCCVCYHTHYSHPIAVCSHTVCTECHKKINICPICRGPK